jgi:enoyl-CoA hydratase
MAGQIVTETRGAMVRLIIDNPAKRNAVSLDMWQALGQALDRAAVDQEVRVLVLTGAGERAFSAGADISRFEDERASEQAQQHYNRIVGQVSIRLERFPKPTLAAIRGVCIGGGVGLATCCDLRLCGESARFGIPAARLGLGYGFASVERVAHLVGPANAQEIYYTARQFNAREAYAMGLVNRVVPDATLDAYVDHYARTIAANAPLTIAAIKAAAIELTKAPSERDLAKVERMVEACGSSQDYVEGRRAFMEKRPPAFTGR